MESGTWPAVVEAESSGQAPTKRVAARAGLAWDRARLARFLADPEAVVPKTEMFIPPLRRAADRAQRGQYYVGDEIDQEVGEDRGQKAFAFP